MTEDEGVFMSEVKMLQWHEIFVKSLLEKIAT